MPAPMILIGAGGVNYLDTITSSRGIFIKVAPGGVFLK